MYYSQISKEQLNDECRALRAQYDELVKKELKLDMSRGKPDTEQVSLSDGILETLRSGGDCISENGTDCRKLKSFFPIYSTYPLKIFWSADAQVSVSCMTR